MEASNTRYGGFFTYGGGDVDNIGYLPLADPLLFLILRIRASPARKKAKKVKVKPQKVLAFIPVIDIHALLLFAV